MWKIQEKEWQNIDSEEPVNGDDDGYTTHDGSPSSDSLAPWFKTIFLCFSMPAPFSFLIRNLWPSNCLMT